MKKYVFFFVAVMLLNASTKAQNTQKFPLSVHPLKLHKSFYAKGNSRANAIRFDSLYFYRDDFQNFETPSEFHEVLYNASTDNLETINIYRHNALKGDYSIRHTIKYSYYEQAGHGFVEEIYYDTDGSATAAISKTVREFDETDILLSSAQELFSVDMQAWVNNLKYIYTYLPGGKIDRIQCQQGDPWTDAFYDQYYYKTNGDIDKIERILNADQSLLEKREYVYNADDVLISLIDYNGTSFARQIDFVYDENQNIISKETTSGFKSTYEYDTSVDIEDVYGPWTEPVYFDDYFIALIKHPVIKKENFLYQFDEWQKSTSLSFVYGASGSVGCKELSMKDFSVFPNPVSQGRLFISLDEAGNNLHVGVFDLQGKELIDKIIKNNASLDISKLSAGIYFIKINSKDKVYSEKIIVR